MAHKRAAGRSPKTPAKRHRHRRGSEESVVLGPNGQPVKEPSSSPLSLRAKVKAGEASKPQFAGRRVWSEADEIRILEALAAHQGAPDHAFYHSLIALLDDKTCNHRDVKEKIRSIERRFRRNAAKGLLPSGDHERRVHELCTTLWSETAGSKSCDALSPSPSRKSSAKGKNVQVPRKEGGAKGAQVVPEEARQGDGGVGAASVQRSFTELCSLYPYLAEEVKGYGELVKTAFENISDDQALSLDARCKKQKIDRLNLEMHQAELTKTLLHTLLGKTN